jgi:hypothetical protein
MAPSVMGIVGAISVSTVGEVEAAAARYLIIDTRPSQSTYCPSQTISSIPTRSSNASKDGRAPG